MIAKPRARLFVPADLAGGRPVALDRGQAHHLAQVLRLTPGDAIALFNGRDGEWLARIDGFGKSSAAVTALEQTRAQQGEPDLWLLFAPIKRARIDFLVEKATELGVSELHPVITERTVAERLNLDRLRAHAVGAAEQTERLTVPVIHSPRKLGSLIAAWPGERRLLLCDETGTAPPIGEVLTPPKSLSQSTRGSDSRDFSVPSPLVEKHREGAWAVLVGPEGGFSQRELDGLRQLAFVCAIGLGPRVLRADTAALAALAAFQALIGDWRAPRGSPGGG